VLTVPLSFRFSVIPTTDRLSKRDALASVGRKISSTPTEDRKKQSERGGKGGHNDRNQNCMLLVAQHHRCAGINLTEHVGAYLIELLIEFVADLIRARQRASGFGKILHFKLAQKLSAFLVQVPIEVVDCVVDVGVDAGERHYAGGNDAPVQRVDRPRIEVLQGGPGAVKPRPPWRRCAGRPPRACTWRR